MVTFNTYVEFQQNSLGEKSKLKKKEGFYIIGDFYIKCHDLHISPTSIRISPKNSSTCFQNNFHLFLVVFVCYRSVAIIFSVEENSPPNWSCIPKQIDSLTAPHVVVGALSKFMTII